MYIDTSALVKLYIGEPDSDACEGIVAQETLVSSRLLYCEFRSGLLGKISRGAVSLEFASEVWSEFERHIEDRRIRLISLNDVLVLDAVKLLNDLHPSVHLRTLDALHLVTYMSVEAGAILTRDRRMMEAATYMGLPLAG
jgi:predicted nucleic acid-binding protein